MGAEDQPAKLWRGPFPGSDIRWRWAQPRNYQAPIDSRSKGQLRAMRTFASGIGRGVNRIDALKEALQLRDGPPSVDFHEQPLSPEILATSTSRWVAYWTEARLQKVADDWMQDVITRTHVKGKEAAARIRMKASTDAAIERLVHYATDPDIEPSMQLKAIDSLMKATGLNSPGAEGEVKNLLTMLQEQAAITLGGALAESPPDQPEAGRKAS